MSKIATSPLHALKSTVSLLKRENLETLVTSRRTHSSEEDAGRAFTRAGDRIVDVNRWGELMMGGILSTEFALFDAEGKPASRIPQKGDFIRMTMGNFDRAPARLKDRLGADWVEVEHFHEDALFVNLRVRPSHDPTIAGGNTAITAHFFTDKARNLISLERHGVEVACTVHGEHEYANCEVPTAGTEERAARNTLMAQLQWGIGRPGFGSTPGERMLKPALGLNQLMWTPFVETLSNGGEALPARERTNFLKSLLRAPAEAGFKGPFGFVIPRAG